MIYLKNKKLNKGFTILETLVAIAIILIAITGPLDIIAQSLKASYYSRDEVVAFYLAQEAIEYARNKRDNNFLDPLTTVDGWLLNDVINPFCLNEADTPDANKCILVQALNGIYSYEICGGNCPVMKKHLGDDGVYGAPTSEPAAEDTNFTREVYFTKVGDGKNEVIMTVNIIWSNSFGTDNRFSLRTNLYNWKITR